MLSIIIPVYGTEKYLPRCVESVLSQTVQDLEVLLIDDGSPDHSGSICDEYAAADARVRVFHTENRGVSAARNVGLREARGDYIGFVDSDDWVEPNMYAELLKSIEETGADICLCGMWYEYLTRREAARDVLDKTYVKGELITALLTNHLKDLVWNKLYRRALWKGIEFPEGHNYEDTSTTFRLVLAAEKITSVSKCLYHYRHRENSITTLISMDNLTDFWTSKHAKYTALIDQPEVRQNEALIRILREEVATGAARAWWWLHKIPEASRDMAQVRAMSDFLRRNFPAFGEPGWRWPMRVSVLIGRHVNEFSFAVGYYMHKFCGYIRRRGQPRDAVLHKAVTDEAVTDKTKRE